MPCRLLNPYIVRTLDSVKHNYTSTRFVKFLDILPGSDNTRIFSDWDAPEEHAPTARPWSILAAPEGTSLIGKIQYASIFHR